MVQVIMKPEIFKYATCKEFAEGFALGAEDLVLTNKFIFEPYFGPLGLKVHTIFQEEYGMGEPTDVMCESIMQDAAKTGCKRIIAIGGGTVIDIAKALAVATEDASMDSLYSVMPALTRKYELVIIPTTCGTGSEVTNIAVFNRTRMGTKMGLVGEAMYADMPEVPDSVYPLRPWEDRRAGFPPPGAFLWAALSPLPGRGPVRRALPHPDRPHPRSDRSTFRFPHPGST